MIRSALRGLERFNYAPRRVIPFRELNRSIRQRAAPLIAARDTGGHVLEPTTKLSAGISRNAAPRERPTTNSPSPPNNAGIPRPTRPLMPVTVEGHLLVPAPSAIELSTHRPDPVAIKKVRSDCKNAFAWKDTLFFPILTFFVAVVMALPLTEVLPVST